MCLNTDLGAAAQPQEQPPVGDAKVLLLPAMSAGQHPPWVSLCPTVLWAPHYGDASKPGPPPGASEEMQSWNLRCLVT